MAAKKKYAFWTTVTPFSKMVALAMLVVLPIVAFYLGMLYQQALGH